MADKYKYNSTQQSFNEKLDDKEISIGDTKQPEFKEEVKVSWNKEWQRMFDISVRLVEDGIFDTAPSAKTFEEKEGKIISTSDFIKNEYSDVIENGVITGKKHNIILFRKPAKNYIDFTLKYKGCDLFHQPPLTEEYKAGWSDKFNCEIDVTETDVIDTKTGISLVHRPANIVNSLALYNNQKAGRYIRGTESDVNYYSGKLGVYERKKAILPDGKELWMPQTFDAKTGILRVYIPDEVLKDESLFDKGLIVDPTFGYTTAGGSEASATTCISMAGTSYRLTASSGDAVVSLHMSGRSASGTTYFKYAVYDFTTVPVTKQQTEVQIDMNSATKQWWSGSYSLSLTSSTVYVTAQSGRSSSNAYVNYDSGSGNQRASHNNAALPATWSNAGWSAALYSNYATYEQASTFKPYSTMYLRK